MNTRILAPALFLLVGLATLSGCKNAPPAQMSGCASDGDCSADAPFCNDGACVACLDNTQCAVGESCDASGTCSAIANFCLSDNDCPAPGRCRDQRCGAECVADSDCDGDSRCRSGSCVARVPEAGECAVLDPIYFDYDESRLSRDALATLERNRECLLEMPRDIVVEGHCDERGTEEYNLALGQRRARTTARYLTDGGVTSGVRDVSYGELRPVDRGHTEGAWSQNRRAAFVDDHRSR